MEPYMAKIEIKKIKSLRLDQHILIFIYYKIYIWIICVSNFF